MNMRPSHILSILLLAVVATGCGTSQLKQAVIDGDHDKIAVLLDQGESPNWQWEGGLLTAYGEAASRGDLRAIELFSDAGYAPNGYLIPEALNNGHTEIIPFLTAYGADVNEVVSGPFTLSQKYYTSMMPALGYAVINNDLDSVKLLLQLGAKTHFRASPGYPGYFSALHMASERGHTAIVKYIASNSSDLNLLVYEKTPIALAAEHGHYRTVAELARLGAFVAYDTKYPQPIELALENGHERVVEFFEWSGVSRPERIDYGKIAADVAEAAVTVALITAGVAIAVEAAKHSAYSPPMYLPQADTSSGKSGPTPQARPRNASQTASESSECSSDYSCGIGRVCVKKPYQNSGICMRSVDAHGTPVYGTPRTESIGPSASPQCQMDSQCPVGFRCDRQYQACVAR